jgi:heme/copper-type cytochrome/quinol oxidase subunit 2
MENQKDTKKTLSSWLSKNIGYIIFMFLLVCSCLWFFVIGRNVVLWLLTSSQDPERAALIADPYGPYAASISCLVVFIPFSIIAILLFIGFRISEHNDRVAQKQIEENKKKL